MTAPLTLLHAAPSPFVRKVRIVALELGRELTLASVSASPIAPRDEVTSANPLGKIPALCLPDGEMLYDSAVICRYLGEGSALYPNGGRLWRALRREALADGLMDAAILIRYELAMRPEALRWDDWIAAQTGKITRALTAMETDLTAQTGFDIGDISTGCALAYLDFRFADLGWRSKHPRLAALHSALSERDSFATTTPD